MSVLVIDSGVANLASVCNALRACGAQVTVGTSRADFAGSSHIVLPGVGAFGPAMVKLRDRGVPELLRDAQRAGKPILGICLGMQVLADSSEEFGEHMGLGLIPGRVSSLKAAGAGQLDVPNVGWFEVVPRGASSLVSMPAPHSMYFTHSYEFLPDDPRDVSSVITVRGREIVASVQRESVTGTQFHPERSGVHGLEMLKRFTGGG